MPDRYTITQLDPRRLDQAFPVVQSSFPQLAIDRWREYAAVMTSGTGAAGIAVAQIGHGYIHGVLGYQVVHSLFHGRTLQVDVFVALNLFDPVPAAIALLMEMERVAVHHDCAAIHLTLPDLPQGPMMETLRQIGMRHEGVRLCKSVATAAE